MTVPFYAQPEFKTLVSLLKDVQFPVIIFTIFISIN